MNLVGEARSWKLCLNGGARYDGDVNATALRRSFAARLRLWMLVAIFLGLWFGLRALNRPEPTFSDQPLSYWMERMADPSTAAHASSVLSELGPDAVPALVSALGTRGSPTRDFVYTAAERVKLAPPRNYDAPNIRATAAYLLGQLGRDAAPAVESLTKSLEDKDSTVRFRAQRALAQITNAQANKK